MNTFKELLSQIKAQEDDELIETDRLCEPEYGDDNEHKVEMNESVLCPNCGIVFKNEVVFDKGIYNFDHHILRNEQDVEEPEPEPVPEVTCVKDLKQSAKKRGIKYYTRMSAEQLCEVLGVEITKPFKYIFTNTKTGVEHKFTSIYQASKKMNINPGLISYYMGKTSK